MAPSKEVALRVIKLADTLAKEVEDSDSGLKITGRPVEDTKKRAISETQLEKWEKKLAKAKGDQKAMLDLDGSFANFMSKYYFD